MPKVIGYTPAWLSNPSPGAKVFSDPEVQSPPPLTKRSSYLSAVGGSSTSQYQGPARLIAQRGTEVFTVVGNKIRWTDLALVKTRWENAGGSIQTSSAVDGEADESAYRTLVVPVYYQIRQLAISPSGAFLAIATEHTVHIALLPDSSRLRDRGHSPVKIKTYQLGPTTHVIPESPVMSVLWHPLAARNRCKDCLITVTAEAAVRLWEIDRSVPWSFEEPTLAIDLRRLADGVSSDDDFKPSGFGKSRGFSVDAFDMEVSAACFGGHGSDDEDPWASMTLWTAMRNGDVYALCPLLPSRWRPSPIAVAALSIDAVAKVSVLDDDDDDVDRQFVMQQYEWVQQIDAADQADTQNDTEDHYVRSRPALPGAIPKLQGPFEVPLSNSTVDVDASDIYIVPAKSDPDEIYSGENEDDDQGPYGELLPYTVICLATTDGQVYVSLDLEGVSGQWLPKQSKSVFSVPETDTRELLSLGTLQTFHDEGVMSDSDWPMFTPDLSSLFNFFLTSTTQISSISLNEWLSKLAAELSLADDNLAGLKTRLETLCQDKLALVDEIMTVPDESSNGSELRLSCPLLFDDPTLGYILLTSTSSQGYAICFDQTHDFDAPFLNTTSPLPLLMPAEAVSETYDPPIPPRPTYTVPDVFERPNIAQLSNIVSRSSSRTAHALKQPVKLSPLVLEALTMAHRSVAPQCSRIEKAAAELFRRCERLQQELNEHVDQIVQLAERLRADRDDAAGDDEEYATVDDRVVRRIEAARKRQETLLERFEEVRRKSARASEGDRALSGKEREWIEEVEQLGSRFGVDVGGRDGQDGHEEDEADTEGQERAQGIDTRVREVQQLARDLLDESRTLISSTSTSTPTFASHPHSTADVVTTNASGTSTSPLRRSKLSPGRSEHRDRGLVTSRLQREKMQAVWAMVQREEDVIEAILEKLGRLAV